MCVLFIFVFLQAVAAVPEDTTEGRQIYRACPPRAMHSSQGSNTPKVYNSISLSTARAAATAFNGALDLRAPSERSLYELQLIPWLAGKTPAEQILWDSWGRMMKKIRWILEQSVWACACWKTAAEWATAFPRLWQLLTFSCLEHVRKCMELTQFSKEVLRTILGYYQWWSLQRTGTKTTQGKMTHCSYLNTLTMTW